MTPEEQIEALKNALREIVQIITSTGQPISNEIKNKLDQVMEHVANRITELRGQESVVDQEPTIKDQGPQLEPGPFPSSNINAFKYDYDNGNLLVKFHGKDSADSGPTYQYSNVPQFIFDTFRKGGVAPKTSGKNKFHEWVKGVTPSLGAAMYHLIRTNYPYQRLS